MRPLVVVFVREPAAGRVKSRLAAGIGTVGAVWWYRHQTARLIRSLAPDPRWRLALAVTPDSAVSSRCWPAHLPRLAQGPGDLGQRMARVLRMGPGPVLIIGSDVPGIDPQAVAGALALLGRYAMVLGPAPDGGFWAIGRKAGAALPSSALAGVRWSTAHARRDSEASLGRLTIGHAVTLRDVDTAADLGIARR